MTGVYAFFEGIRTPAYRKPVGAFNEDFNQSWHPQVGTVFVTKFCCLYEESLDPSFQKTNPNKLLRPRSD